MGHPPDQIAIANEVFAPTEAEVAEAAEAIEVYRASEADGVGAIGRDGRLVDAAHMRLAENVLHKASLAAREERPAGALTCETGRLVLFHRPVRVRDSGGTMTAVMQGVRILEVAEHTFVPAASALLADWGAEVIKIEHVERGDAMRGLPSTGVGMGHRRARAARALQPREEEPRPRSHLDRGPRHPLPARRHLRRLPHQQAAERPRRS